MRRVALAAALLLTACTSPSGAAVDACGVDWHDVEPVIAVGPVAGAEPIGIACIRTIGERRIRVGFEMPPGPECHLLARVDVDEGAEAVAVTLHVGPSNDPAAGTCAPRSVRTTTEVDLQAPIGNRALLDGSR